MVYNIQRTKTKVMKMANSIRKNIKWFICFKKSGAFGCADVAWELDV